jgi:hypothetical protein
VDVVVVVGSVTNVVERAVEDAAVRRHLPVFEATMTGHRRGARLKP